MRAIAGKPIGAWRSLRAGAGLLTLSIILPVSCVYDASDRCGPNQRLDDEYERCVCADGFAFTPGGCVRCGPNETSGASGCECKSGFSRQAAGGECEETPVGLGSDCDSSTPCTDQAYDHCEIKAGASRGYCTSTDCDSGSCDGGYACDDRTSPSVCRRPPVGQGKSCSAPADCADTEATFCDTVGTHGCVVQGCTVDPNDCYPGWDCCDLTRFGVPQPICVPEGACPP